MLKCTATANSPARREVIDVFKVIRTSRLVEHCLHLYCHLPLLARALLPSVSLGCVYQAVWLRQLCSNYAYIETYIEAYYHWVALQLNCCCIIFPYEYKCILLKMHKNCIVLHNYSPNTTHIVQCAIDTTPLLVLRKKMPSYCHSPNWSQLQSHVVDPVQFYSCVRRNQFTRKCTVFYEGFVNLVV